MKIVVVSQATLQYFFLEAERNECTLLNNLSVAFSIKTLPKFHSDDINSDPRVLVN